MLPVLWYVSCLSPGRAVAPASWPPKSRLHGWIMLHSTRTSQRTRAMLYWNLHTADHHCRSVDIVGGCLNSDTTLTLSCFLAVVLKVTTLTPNTGIVVKGGFLGQAHETSCIGVLPDSTGFPKSKVLQFAPCQVKRSLRLVPPHEWLMSAG